MNRVAAVDQRYRTTSVLTRYGVSLLVVADASGEALNNAIRGVARMAVEDDISLWERVLGAAKALRWRMVFRPQPLEFNPYLALAVDAVIAQSGAIRPAVGQESIALLDALDAAARRVKAADPPIGAQLLESILEVGQEACVVVTDGTGSSVEVGAWLEPLGFRVLSPGMLSAANVVADISYVVGPPRLMRSSLVTAPPTPEVSFFVPSWFADRTLPASAIADYAHGAIRPSVREFPAGSLEVELPARTDEMEPLESFAPQPMWGSFTSADREPGVDEVVARKVLLSGGYAIWMDDGERIRTLDPSQPPGERVMYTDVGAVGPATYLVLRVGATERAALYDAAMQFLGPRRVAVESSQDQWKRALRMRIESAGRHRVEEHLRRLGVRAAHEAYAWTQPTLARPQRDEDFRILLRWLGLDEEPSFSNAAEFRRVRSRAASSMREQLERAMASTDLEALRASGHVEIDGEGFADIIATRVLAISSRTSVIARRDARHPFHDGGGQWLE